MKVTSLIFCIFVMTSISGCAIQRAEVATKAKTSMVGMSKQQILQCMGVAEGVQKEGNVEVWKYNSGGDYRGTANAYTNDQYTTVSTTLNKRSCEVNVIFGGNIVTGVMYSGRTGGLLSQGEQCAYAVSNCVK